MMMLTNNTQPNQAVALAVNGAGGAECAGGRPVAVRGGSSAAMTGPACAVLPGARRPVSDGHRVLLVSMRLPGRAEPARCAPPDASSGRDGRLPGTRVRPPVSGRP